MQKFSITDDQSLKAFGVELKKILKKIPDWRIVSIDGAMQSGKSTIITTFISKLLNAARLDLDTVISIDESNVIFRGQLKIETHKKYIADGILNRYILDHFNLTNDLSIYVKKMVNYGWVERNWLDKELVADYGLDESFKSSNIDRQIYRYHNEYSPVENADIVIEMSEDYVTKDFH